MHQLTHKLETVYRTIERERMGDMPVCNPALRVEAVNFREWGAYYLGVMITPWFMNLMLLPASPDTSGEWQVGSKQIHAFPSGRYEFICGDEDGLGRYLTCALFSPMFEFDDQQAVVATANTVLTALMEPGNRDTALTHEKTIQDLWRSEAGTENAASASEAPEKSLTQTALSRREFLRGGRVLDARNGHGD